jgi:hypothetical protein
VKEKLVNAGLVIASIMFSLLGLEVSLRAYHGEWKFVNFRFPAGISDQPAAVFDAELGWVPKPGVQPLYSERRTATILEGGIRSNGYGELRDTREPILAAGDSFTFGNEVSDRETWPAQLEKLSGRRVINGGVFGYGVDQSFLRARTLLSSNRYSTVIFSFIPTDIDRSAMSVASGAAKPYFDFKDGRLTVENVPVPPPSPRRTESGALIALEHSRLVHAVMKRLYPEWWVQMQKQVLNPEKKKEVVCALLHELERLTKSHGSALIVLVQYLKEDVDNLSKSIDVERTLSCLSDPATRILDLGLVLSELKAEDLSAFNGMYVWSMTDEGMKAGHMSAEGNQFVARELSELLSKKGGGSLIEQR